MVSEERKNVYKSLEENRSLYQYLGSGPNYSCPGKRRSPLTPELDADDQCLTTSVLLLLLFPLWIDVLQLPGTEWPLIFIESGWLQQRFCEFTSAVSDRQLRTTTITPYGVEHAAHGAI